MQDPINVVELWPSISSSAAKDTHPEDKLFFFSLYIFLLSIEKVIAVFSKLLDRL